MTPDQIKTLARQAGGSIADHPTGNYSALFIASGLAEFVRLVREGALDEAAITCDDEKWVIGAQRQSTYMETFNKACDDCTKAIRSLKK